MPHALGYMDHLNSRNYGKNFPVSLSLNEGNRRCDRKKWTRCLYRSPLLFHNHHPRSTHYGWLSSRDKKPRPTIYRVLIRFQPRPREILIGYFNGGLGHLTGYIKNRFIITPHSFCRTATREEEDAGGKKHRVTKQDLGLSFG